MKIDFFEFDNGFSFSLEPDNKEEAALLLRFANMGRKETVSIVTSFDSGIYTDFTFGKKKRKNTYNRIRDGKTTL